MPLHLLGKKSWNVYNRDNIARVRRDELEAKAREEREDRERQQDEAERRLRILRGQSPISPRKNLEQSEQKTPTRRHEEPFDSQSRTKRRKLANENDTDRDIRLAKHDVELRRNTHRGNLIFRNDNTPLFDEAGHISLFSAGSKSASKKDEKNTETEIELLRKQCEYEDQHTMRFSKAAGYRQSMENPWYSSSKSLVSCSEMPTKDIWGNEDIRRHEREKDRISTSDPLTIMKRGVRQLREVEKAREYSNNPRSRKNLDRLDRPYSDSKCHRKRSKESINSLDDFSLDVCRNSDGDDRRHHSRHSHHSRHRRHHRHHGHSREKGSRVL